jgi:subtilase family serine protease
MKYISIIIVFGIVQSCLTTVALAVVGQKYPNLIIDSITPDLPQPQAGAECKVTVVVKNNGNETARNFEVCLWKSHTGEPADNTGADAFLSVPSLASGEKKSLNFQVLWSQDGTFSIWALADAGNVVDEIDKTDNTRSCLIQIAPSSTTSVPGLLGDPMATVTPTPAPQSSSTGNCFIPGISLTLLLSLACVLITKFNA